MPHICQCPLQNFSLKLSQIFLVRFHEVVEFDGLRQTVEQLLAEDQRRVVDRREDFRLAFPPDEDVVERDAAGDDDEGHGNTEALVRQCERQDEDEKEEGEKENRNDLSGKHYKTVFAAVAKIYAGGSFRRAA